MEGRLKGFDGIRGLAVLSVVLTHAGVFHGLKQAGFLSKDQMVLVAGRTGVQGFFVLSGFLITMLLIREYERTRSISLYNFYVRRTLRIFPLYFACIFCLTAISLVGPEITNWTSLAYAFTYTYNFIPREAYSEVIGHTWSLAVEEHFYLVWPFLFSLTFVTKKRFLVALLVVFSLSTLLSSNVFSGVFQLNGEYFVDRWSFIAGNGIALGCLLALLLCSGARSDDWRRVLGHKGALALATVLYLNSLYLPGNPYFIGWYLRGIAIALFVSWVFLNQDNRITQWLEFAPLKYIGLISYGIYMYQGLLLSTVSTRTEGQVWPPDTMTGLFILCIVAPLSFHFFEKPLMRLKDKYQVPTTPRDDGAH